MVLNLPEELKALENPPAIKSEGMRFSPPRVENRGPRPTLVLNLPEELKALVNPPAIKSKGMISAGRDHGSPSYGHMVTIHEPRVLNGIPVKTEANEEEEAQPIDGPALVLLMLDRPTR